MEPRPPSDELQRNVHADERIQWVVRPKTSARLATEATGAIIGGTVGGGVVAAGAFYGLTELLGEPAALATPVAVVAFVLVLARHPAGASPEPSSEASSTPRPTLNWSDSRACSDGRSPASP